MLDHTHLSLPPLNLVLGRSQRRLRCLQLGAQHGGSVRGVCGVGARLVSLPERRLKVNLWVRCVVMRDVWWCVIMKCMTQFGGHLRQVCGCPGGGVNCDLSERLRQIQ